MARGGRNQSARMIGGRIARVAQLSLVWNNSREDGQWWVRQWLQGSRMGRRRDVRHFCRPLDVLV